MSALIGRKGVTWVLALLGVVLLVVGCGRQDRAPQASPVAAGYGPQEPPVTIDFWYMPNGPSPDKVIRREIDRFEALHPNITVRATKLEWPDALTRLTTAAASGSGPDVSQLGTTWVGSISSLGGLRPFTDDELIWLVQREGRRSRAAGQGGLERRPQRRPVRVGGGRRLPLGRRHAGDGRHPGRAGRRRLLPEARGQAQQSPGAAQHLRRGPASIHRRASGGADRCARVGGDLPEQRQAGRALGDRPHAPRPQGTLHVPRRQQPLGVEGFSAPGSRAGVGQVPDR